MAARAEAVKLVKDCGRLREEVMESKGVSRRATSAGGATASGSSHCGLEDRFLEGVELDSSLGGVGERKFRLKGR
jgi:hypothetical protein